MAELAAAAQGSELSEYHLQAGIAALHCTAANYASTNWAAILTHYDELYRRKSSPIIALNREVAVANLHGPSAGLEAIAAIADLERLESSYLLPAVIGELHWRLNQHAEAAKQFRRALQLAQVGPEQQHLQRMLERSTSVQPQ